MNNLYTTIHNVPVEIKSFFNSIEFEEDPIRTDCMQISLADTTNIDSLYAAWEPNAGNVINGLRLYSDSEMTEEVWSTSQKFKLRTLSQHYDNIANAENIIIGKDLILNVVNDI